MEIHPLIIAGIGTAAGWILKSALDYYVRRRELRLKHEHDRSVAQESARDHARRTYYVPLSRSLALMLSRFNIAAHDLGVNFGYKELYISTSFAYELCCTCFWLDAPNRDPSINEYDLGSHEATLRNAIAVITGVPLYSQRILSERIQDEANPTRPIGFDAFRKRMKEILDVEYVEESRGFRDELLRWYHERPENLNEKVRDGVSRLTWMALKCEERAETDGRRNGV